MVRKEPYLAALGLAMVGFFAQVQYLAAGPLGGWPVAGVVFDAGDQQRNPAAEHQNLTVLLEGETLAEGLGDPAEPRSPSVSSWSAGVNGYSEHNVPDKTRSPFRVTASMSERWRLAVVPDYPATTTRATG